MATKVDYFYQTVSFCFSVKFGLGTTEIDARFQSVSGLEVQLETETLKEGGENRFEHVLPVRTKYPDLILKRGLISPETGSELTKWCKKAFDQFGYNGFDLKKENKENLPVRPINLVVQLLNEKHEPLMQWKVIHAWPKAWKFGELNAEKSEVLIETLELNYNYFEFQEVPENERRN